jgi:hypothetical protein
LDSFRNICVIILLDDFSQFGIMLFGCDFFAVLPIKSPTITIWQLPFGGAALCTGGFHQMAAAHHSTIFLCAYRHAVFHPKPS